MKARKNSTTQTALVQCTSKQTKKSISDQLLLFLSCLLSLVSPNINIFVMKKSKIDRKEMFLKTHKTPEFYSWISLLEIKGWLVGSLIFVWGWSEGT